MINLIHLCFNKTFNVLNKRLYIVSDLNVLKNSRSEYVLTIFVVFPNFEFATSIVNSCSGCYLYQNRCGPP